MTTSREPQPDAPGTKAPGVGARAASGVAWNVSLGVMVRAVGVLGTLAMARFVAPADYGTVAAAAVCVATATRFVSLGAGTYIIARRSDPRETFEAGLLHVAAIALCCCAVTLLARPLSIAVGSPGMEHYVPWLALAAVIGQAPHIAGATLVRALQFKVVATARAASELAFTAVSVGLAPFWGAPAIVAGSLARAVTLLVLFVARSDRSTWWAPALPRRRTLQALVRFGGPVAGAGVANLMATQWDNLLVSRLFGPAVLGQYNLAYNLASTPSGQVAENIGDVLEPSLGLIEPARRKQEAARAAGLMSMVLAPMALGLAAVASTLVPLLFDARWQPMVPMLVVLCAMSLSRPVAWIVDAILRLQLRTEILLALELFKALSVLGGIIVLAPAGPVFACAAVPIAFGLHGLAAILTAWRIEGIPPARLIALTARPAVAAALMAVSVVGASWTWRALGMPAGWTEVAIQVVIGVVSYAGLSRLIAYSTFQDFVALARQALGRPS